MYIKVIDNKPIEKYTVDEIMHEHPNVDIFGNPILKRAKKPSEKLLADIGFYPVITTQYPDIWGKVTYEVMPERRDDGKWYQVWKVREFDQTERNRIFVTKEVVKHRFSICNKCKYYKKFTKICAECGCWMPLKRKLKYVGCPKDKW
jgi:hypothetical protein